MLYVKDQQRWMELCCGIDGKKAESLCVSIGDKPTQGMLWVSVCVCYKLPGWKEADKVFFRQLEKASCSLVLVLMGNWNHGDIFWCALTEQIMMGAALLMSCLQTRKCHLGI